MPSIGEEFPKQQARLRMCLQHGAELGPAGAFYCMTIEHLLKRADEAVMNQDLPEMISIFAEMKAVKE